VPATNSASTAPLASGLSRSRFTLPLKVPPKEQWTGVYGTVVVVTEWFARLDLSGAPAPHQRVIGHVSELLDQLQPARLNPGHQTVVFDQGETWVKLRHDSEPWLKIEFGVSGSWVNFYGVMGDDEAYPAHTDAGDQWETDTIDILADLLQADFSVETYTVGGRPWREVVTIGAPYHRTSAEARSLMGALPLNLWARHTGSQHATFECLGSRPSTEEQ